MNREDIFKRLTDITNGPLKSLLEAREASNLKKSRLEESLADQEQRIQSLKVEIIEAGRKAVEAIGEGIEPPGKSGVRAKRAELIEAEDLASQIRDRALPLAQKEAAAAQAALEQAVRMAFLGAKEPFEEELAGILLQAGELFDAFDMAAKDYFQKMNVKAPAGEAGVLRISRENSRLQTYIQNIFTRRA